MLVEFSISSPFISTILRVARASLSKLKKRNDINPNFSECYPKMKLLAKIRERFRELREPGKVFCWRLGRSREVVETIKCYVDLKQKNVVDGGCGFGALSYLLCKENLGSKVFALDISFKNLEVASTYCVNLNVNFVRGSIDEFPFPPSFFDVIILLDVLEHVRDPEKTIRECMRILKRGGLLYSEFTPYYSLIAGHHMYDFTFLPLQFLPESFAFQYILFKRSQRELERFRSLNKLTITKFRRMIRKYNVKVLFENYIVKYPPFLNIGFKLLKYGGIMGELIPMSYISIIKKL